MRTLAFNFKIAWNLFACVCKEELCQIILCSLNSCTIISSLQIARSHLFVLFQRIIKYKVFAITRDVKISAKHELGVELIHTDGEQAP